MSPKNIQALLISGALVLFVLLFIASKTPSQGADKTGAVTKMAIPENASLEVYLNLAIKNLEPGLKQKSGNWLALRQNDSLALFWDKLKRPDLASVYTEAQAKKENSAAAWFKAGNRYYYAVQFTKDQTEIPLLYYCAMRCFNKGLALDPANTEARIMLASCYVEGSGDPMEGINRLREIEKTDSNNVKLQLAFAFFSVKSGQLDRAIVRFNKILVIDSNYVEAYLHLADAYEQQGNTGKTIEALEKYASKTPEIMVRNEINNYIQQLKNKH